MRSLDRLASKFREWSRIPFGPLLAKCVLAVALFCPIVFVALYPARKEEADAYADARPCAVGVNNSSNCRLIANAVFIDYDCQNNTFPHPGDFCEVRLEVNDSQRFIAVDRSEIENLPARTPVRVELFQKGPTRIELNGRFIEERGSPREAVRMLKVALAFWVVLGFVAAIYLFLQKSRTKHGNR